MMISFISLLLCFAPFTYQFTPASQLNLKTRCEGSNKNTLVEHFFNIIFNEFYHTPPVCVCVQMCLGQSTYCYPNGCLKRDEVKGAVETPQSVPQSQGQQFMLINEEKNDFMADFLEKNYVDEFKTKAPPTVIPLDDLRPDVFKDKYKMFLKHKKSPQIELRYNLQDQVKNTKSDQLKMESVNLSKTRWPLSKHNRLNGHKSLSENKQNIFGQTKLFATVFSDVAGDYPLRYIKRDLPQSTKNDNAKLKNYYNSDHVVKLTHKSNLTLETLLDSLIRSNFDADMEKDVTTEYLSTSEIDTETETETTTQEEVTEKLLPTETKIISLNLTNENLDRNKYIDIFSVVNRTRRLHDMIKYLSKRIEKHNNTSFEIASRVLGIIEDKKAHNDDESFIVSTDNAKEISRSDQTTTADADYGEDSRNFSVAANQETEISTTATEIFVTKKNRQRTVRKYYSKTNK